MDDFGTDAVGHGGVAPYLCLSVGEGPDPDAGHRRARAVLETLEQLSVTLPVPVPVHLRVDIGDPASAEGTAELLRRHGERIGLVSAMDHTPGQGQYGAEAAWRTAMGARLRLGDHELDRWLRTLRDHAADIPARRRRTAELAAAHHIVFGTHDPDSPAAISAASDIGTRIC